MKAWVWRQKVHERRWGSREASFLGVGNLAEWSGGDGKLGENCPKAFCGFGTEARCRTGRMEDMIDDEHWMWLHLDFDVGYLSACP